MATAAGVSGTAADSRRQAARKLVDNLQSDLRALSSEARRRHPPVKEAAESGIVRVRTAASKSDDIIAALQAVSADLLHPLALGCETRGVRIVQICLGCMQRLITHGALSVPAGATVVRTLWSLMEGGIEELKLLQTIIILLTTNSIVQGDSLAMALVMCFRLHFTKDSTTINTASATVRQMVTLVFERVEAEDKTPAPGNLQPLNIESLKLISGKAPTSLRPCAGDAYRLFQDLCQLVNADQPMWLVGMTEMTRTFGLELMESLLTTFPDVFMKHPEFSFLLKERVCPLVIKLFSPNIKHGQQRTVAPPAPGALDKPYFPISVRLLRVVCVLIQQYYSLLVTECEIFLSLLVRFLDGDKPVWQRAVAVEVLHKLCVQATLLRMFCESYDMKPHSTKIFRDLVNALGAFIQSQFVQSHAAAAPQPGGGTGLAQGQPPALVAGMPVGAGVTPQPAFIYRSVWLPVTAVYTPGTTKPVFLDMLDKVECHGVAEGYGVSVAYACMLEIVRSLSTIIDDLPKPSPGGVSEPDPARKGLEEELITSSWCGVLAALSLLLDASTDESTTEAILKCAQAYTSLCGRRHLVTPRDAFITSLCKASLPPHYSLTVLSPAWGGGGGGGSPAINAATAAVKQGHIRTNSQDMAAAMLNSYQGDGDVRNQVVAVGTPLATASLPMGAQQNSVMLTAKNLQCMRAILSMAHCHGSVLGTAWHLVLTTLQHLVWILGLKPSAGGSLKAGRLTEGQAVLTTAVLTDLPVLSAMLSRLFESSQYLDEVALHHLIDALCKLSSESMELAYNNREPSLFAVAKLLETGLVNLPRVQVLWKPVTNHMLEVCQHPHYKMREWGAEAVTSLVKSALEHPHEPPLADDPKFQRMILLPLSQLSSMQQADVRQKQLDCVLQIIQHSGDGLAQGWPIILGVIGALSNDQGEILIRTAFQSLQLVVTDFLPAMPCACLRDCLDVAARFGSQDQELNISLTAVGLLWNISDFLYQNRVKITASLASDATGAGRGGAPPLPPFDALWMCLFSRLGDLCVDPRPAVRKSAGQTLFSTIAAHGGLLQQGSWQGVLWQVLFPLLDRVKKESGTASTDRNDVSRGVNILIHHSRDTAEKQWAETRVLTLAGVARVFSTKRATLVSLGDFPRAWALLLNFVEISAMSRNAEISLSALKSLQEVLQVTREGDDQPVANGDVVCGTAAEDQILWTNAWKVWYNIGVNSTAPPDSDAALCAPYLPSQPYLTTLVQIVPLLFDHIKPRFVAADMAKLMAVLRNALAVPVNGEASPFIVPACYDSALTPLQDAVLTVAELLHKEALAGGEHLQAMYPDMFAQLLRYVEYGVEPPRYLPATPAGHAHGHAHAKVTAAKNNNNAVAAAGSIGTSWVTMNFVPFAERALELVVALYTRAARHPTVVRAHVLRDAAVTLRLPLARKYACAAPSIWRKAVATLLALMDVGLPIAREPEEAPHFETMWKELATTIEHFLFTKSVPPATMTVEEHQHDEAIDCKVIQKLRDDILPFSSQVPAEFTAHVMAILNKGSIHAASSSSFIDTEPSCKLREDFAKTCFSTLLQFSFVKHGEAVAAGGGRGRGGGGSPQEPITKLAVTSLLDRCQQVVSKYMQDEALSGKCPLPRTQVNEMVFVLKAVSTLLVSLKKAPPEYVDASIWLNVIALYPSLVACITSVSPHVSAALKEALHEFAALLQPPDHQ